MRSFVSIDVGALDTLVELEGEMEKTGASLKLVEPENIHITLKFLGEIGEDMVPEIEGVMREAAEGVEPFTVTFEGMGAFPGMNYVRVVWVGVKDGGEMAKISERINKSLAPHGFKKESFKPHITLARVKSARGKENLVSLIERNAGRNFGEMGVESIRLKKSELRKEGPVYTTVKEVRL